MKNTNNTQQLILGIILGVGITVSIAAVKGNPGIGRFQIGATQNQAFVIDTFTGEVWSESQGQPKFSKPKTED